MFYLNLILLLLAIAAIAGIVVSVIYLHMDDPVNYAVIRLTKLKEDGRLLEEHHKESVRADRAEIIALLQSGAISVAEACTLTELDPNSLEEVWQQIKSRWGKIRQDNL